jgi:hypothetical protein
VPQIPQIKGVIAMDNNTLITEIISRKESEQVEIFNTVIKLPAVKETLFSLFAEFLAISELKVLKRLSTVETVLGLNDMADEDEPTIPEQIKELANRIEQPLNKSTERIEIEVPVIPSTTLEHKANALIEHLKEKVKPRNDAVFMNSNEIITFLKNDIEEDLRLKDIKNPRQAKKDILEKAVKLFSDSVQIIRNKSGNKVTGIALKPSVKRTDTYGC